MPLTLPPSLPGLVQPIRHGQLCTTRSTLAEGELEASFLATRPNTAEQYRLAWEAKAQAPSEIAGRFVRQADGRALRAAQAIFTLTFDAKRISQLRGRGATMEVKFSDGSIQRRSVMPFPKPGPLSKGPITQSVVLAVEAPAFAKPGQGVTARVVLPNEVVVMEAHFDADALTAPRDLTDRVLAEPFGWNASSSWRCSLKGWK